MVISRMFERAIHTQIPKTHKNLHIHVDVVFVFMFVYASNLYY